MPDPQTCISATHIQSFSRARKETNLRLGALALGHFFNDTYVAFVPPLLPLLVTKLHLSMALAGALAAVPSVISSLVQPILGYAADSCQNRLFVVLGPLLTALAMSLIGIAPSHSSLIAILVLAGLGTGSFHPQAAAMAGSLDKTKKAFLMSIFVTAGEVGYALGPIFVLSIVTTLGLGKTPLTFIPGALIATVLYFLAPKPNVRPQIHPAVGTSSTNKGPSLLLQAKPLFLLWAIAVLRSMVSMGFLTFLPVFFCQRGLSLMAGGASSSVFLLSGSAGVVIGGYFSHRLGAKNLMILSLALPIPLLFAFLSVDGPFALILLAVGGMALYSSTPLNTIMAQELAPDKASTVSGLMMGLAWGVGSLTLAPVGMLADRAGIATALGSLTCILAVALFFASRLRP